MNLSAHPDHKISAIRKFFTREHIIFYVGITVVVIIPIALRQMTVQISTIPHSKAYKRIFMLDSHDAHIILATNFFGRRKLQMGRKPIQKIMYISVVLSVIANFMYLAAGY